MDKVRPQQYSLSTSSSLPLSKVSEDSTRFKRRRTRSGCVTCRDRHIKCDEGLPICNNCLRLRRVCYRGLRLNFTQYTFYDPRKDNPIHERILDGTILPHRILDQSITIAALYNGLEKYRPYMQLHSQQDLKDSDLEYQDDSYVPLNDPIFSSLSTKYHPDLSSTHRVKLSEDKSGSKSLNRRYNHSSPRYIKNNLKTEQPLTYSNQDVLNMIHQPQMETNLPSLNLTQQPFQMLNYAALPSMQVTSALRYTNLGIANQNTIPLNYDFQHYINILVKEQFYWLLDQFNDFNIWKAIIPEICVKEKDNFLFSCLMNCSRDPTISDAIDLKFLIDFQNFKYNQVKNIELMQTSNLSLFETLLISICLVLLGIYLKVPHGRLTSFHKQVLNNQSNLFDQLLAKLFIYFMHLGNSEKSLVISSCIQSITILKFFMNKYYDLAFLQKQSAQFTNIDPLSNVGVSSFIKFNSYEINYLNTSYQNIDITSHPSNSPPQATHTLLQNINLAASTMHEYGINQSPQISSTETRKLKDLLWYLVKLDYIINFPNETVQFSTFNSAEQVLDPQLQIITPEQLFSLSQSTNYQFRPVARAILQNFTFKLLNMNDGMIVQQSNLKIQQYLEMSKNNGPEYGLSQLQCMHYFGWALRYVNPS